MKHIEVKENGIKLLNVKGIAEYDEQMFEVRMVIAEMFKQIGMTVDADELDDDSIMADSVWHKGQRYQFPNYKLIF